MHCRKARLAAIERGLGLLAPHRAAALDSHLAGCPACAAALRADDLLVEDLTALGHDAPLHVDVAARVLAGIAPSGPASREDVPARQLGWAGAAAALVTVVVVAALAGQWQQVETLLLSGATITSKLLGFADVVVTPLISLASWGGRLLGRLGQSLIDLASYASRLEPLAWAAVWSGYGVMASTVALVLLKDLKRPLNALSRGRT